jgi:hypothetical protein
MTRLQWIAGLGLLTTLLAWDDQALAQGGVDPFMVSKYTLPASYKGPKFVLNHGYPKTQPQQPADPPWTKVSHGAPLTRENALAYVEALKEYVAPAMRKLILDYPNWDPAKEGWYSMPWLFDAQEPTHGTLRGATFQPSMFPLSGLKKSITTYLVTMYDPTAAYMLGQVWGDDARKPDLTGGKPLYPEGAIVIKAALTTAMKSDWSPIDGATVWTLFAPSPDDALDAPPRFFDVSFFQFDIIIKDSKAAPESQWVFSTLVYDKRVKGDAWNRMVPLGAMWGNDPLINSADDPNAILQQSVINPMAPLYATETLGYGGRLSGPNDAAVVQNVLVNGKAAPRVAASSCMSCHGVAEWPMKSFMLPMASSVGTESPYFGRALPTTMDLRTAQGPNYLYEPGSMLFNSWFQSRRGDVPQDPGGPSLDYHMNLTWKALPLWTKYNPSFGAGGAGSMAATPASSFPMILADPALTPSSGLAPKH